jgi:hypothetical protein
VLLLQVWLWWTWKEKRASTNTIRILESKQAQPLSLACLAYHGDIACHRQDMSFCPKICTDKCEILDSSQQILCVLLSRCKTDTGFQAVRLCPYRCRLGIFAHSI